MPNGQDRKKTALFIPPQTEAAQSAQLKAMAGCFVAQVSDRTNERVGAETQISSTGSETGSAHRSTTICVWPLSQCHLL